MNKHSDQEPSSFEPETVVEMTGPRHLTRSQAKAHELLFAMAALRGQNTEYAGMKPRARPLLIGPSGAGKTAVIRRLCDSLSTPEKPFRLLSLNMGGFIVFGARATPATLTVIRDFVRKNDTADDTAGCIFLDELDKITATSSGWTDHWTSSVVSEVIALLDMDDRLLAADWLSEDICRLKSWLIIGAGTFQRYAKPSSTKRSSYATFIKNDPGIPDEVILRFNARFLPIDLPTRSDFRGALGRLYNDLQLPLPAPGMLEKFIDEAETSRSGMRWMEQHLSDLLCLHPKKIRPTDPIHARKEKRSVSEEYLRQEFNEFYKLLENIEPRIAMMRCQWRLYAPQLNQALTPEPPDPFVPEGPGMDIHLRDLQDALYFRFDEKLRADREKVLWASGHAVEQALDTLLRKVTKYLQEAGLVSNFALVHARLKRILAAMTHIGKLRADGA